MQRFVVHGPQEAIEPRLFDRTESFRFLDKAGCLDIASLRLPDSPLGLARVRSTGHEILLEEPDRISIILPWSGTVSSEVDGDVFRTGANGVLVFDPNRRRTTVQRTSPAAPYIADLLTLPKADLQEVCRRNDLPLMLNHHLLVPNVPAVGHLRRLISATLTQFEHDPEPHAAGRTLSHVTASLADALTEIAVALASPTDSPVSAGQRRVRLALEVMEALHAEPVSISAISAICDRLDCSARSLQLAFLKYGLPSPHDVLTHIRLDRARSYLLEGTMNVTQAATEAGFVHMSRFSGLYMRAFGEYPIRTLGSRRSEH